MATRNAVVAGQFYPASHKGCVEEIIQFVKEIRLPKGLPEQIAAGVVPHAGWFFSGKTAAMVFTAVRERDRHVDTFVIFGAAHSYYGDTPAVYEAGAWETPVGIIDVDEELARKILDTGEAVANAGAHGYEHSIEVQVPFVQYLFPQAKIVPVLTPPVEGAVALGEAVGDIIKEEGAKRIVCIGSTDLTHYGPRYGFQPQGVGPEAIRWAKNVNDKEFIDFALKLEPAKMMKSAAAHSNACGPGAAAASVAAAKTLGKTKGILLEHINSSEVMSAKMGQESQESVGYAAIVF